jgi:hypothetical protein
MIHCCTAAEEDLILQRGSFHRSLTGNNVLPCADHASSPWSTFFSVLRTVRYQHLGHSDSTRWWWVDLSCKAQILPLELQRCMAPRTGSDPGQRISRNISCKPQLSALSESSVVPRTKMTTRRGRACINRLYDFADSLCKSESERL